MVDNFEVKYRKVPVKISIKGSAGIRDFVFIVDTGAAHSIINSKLLKSIGYSQKDCFKTESLSGFGGNSIEVDFIRVKSAFCLGLLRTNFVLGCNEFRSTVFYDGILGLDFFLNHKLCIDLKKGLISLE